MNHHKEQNVSSLNSGLLYSLKEDTHLHNPIIHYGRTSVWLGDCKVLQQNGHEVVVTYRINLCQ